MLTHTESFGYLTNLLARLFARALDGGIAPFGLGHGQFPALLVLWNRPGLTQSDLARITAVEQPTMANTLKRMERDGLIERHPDPADGRRTLVYPSARALEMRAAVMDVAAAVNARAADGLTVEEQGQFKRLIGRMIGNLERVPPTTG